jgi:hypothetical protein
VRSVALAVTLAGGIVLGPAAGLAQERASPGAEADSVRARILERLRRLARPPGADSVLYAQDSARLAAAAQGLRPEAAAAPDSIVRQLLSIPDYSLTEYQGGAADFRVEERMLVLRAPEGGRARVTREGMRIEADTSIVLDQASGRVRMVGNPTFTPPDGEPITSAQMVYDLDEERGTALDAETAYTQRGARWLVRGDMPFAARDSSFMSHARFTSCDLEVPHYHFETDEIKIIGGNLLVARGVRLYFADVPVFWLPFIAQSLTSGRSSGLLTPRFSVNDVVRTSTGYRRRVSNVGLYWAMSDYSDALVALDWFSDTFVSVTASAQYAWARQFLGGSLNVRRYWQEGGGTQLALDTQHSWQMDERTDVRISGRYASSNDFVRDNSFNPREVTQSIDSEGGFNRRFDWGALSVSANRQQYLSDDRTEMTLPSASLSLTPITLFRAAPSEARFWNNVTWSGTSRVSRRTVNREGLPADTFSFAEANTVKSTGGVTSNLSIGSLTFSQSVDVAEDETLAVPEALLLLGPGAAPGQLVVGQPARDISQTNVSWTTSLSYQQQLIGSTTLTPRLAVSGRMFRADTSSLAQDFVSAPARVSLGAQLKTDVYGFYPGFGPYDAVRHKLSPAFDYQWSPESRPNDLQRQVFGARVLQPQNVVGLTLNQTWEARRRAAEGGGGSGTTAAAAGLGASPGGGAAPMSPLAGAPADSARAWSAEVGGSASSGVGGPRRVPRAQIVNLVALRTSVIRYDFVQADSAGSFLHGFETTRLSNQISSDLLRGLAVSMDHELFDDTPGPSNTIARRRFDPHLAQVNLSFSLGSTSALFRWLGLSGARDGGEVPAEPEPASPVDPFDVQGATDESTVIPRGGAPPAPERSPASGTRGTWSASFSYSLQRPRVPTSVSSQMLTATLRLQPTDAWELSWRTAYDLEARGFNDHSIRLTRDLHRWQANFDFLQTATGNWSFRFEVALMDNRDLKFDYDQQNLDLGRRSRTRSR